MCECLCVCVCVCVCACVSKLHSYLLHKLKRETLKARGFSTNGTIISASSVPYREIQTDRRCARTLKIPQPPINQRRPRGRHVDTASVKVAGKGKKSHLSATTGLRALRTGINVQSAAVVDITERPPSATVNGSLMLHPRPSQAISCAGL